MSSNLYDAHCHLQDARLRPHLKEIGECLKEIGLAGMVVNGTQENDWPAVLELAARWKFVTPSLGVHPWYIEQRSPEWLARLTEAPGKAIGEIGLDRWMPRHNTTEQENTFVAQLDLAAKRDLPVSVHCLKAWGRLLAILSSSPLPRRGFLLHSYGGPAEMIPEFVALGGYFSMSGYFAHRRKARQQEVFRRVPIDRLLIETDAPDMLLPAELIEFSLPDPALNHPANLRAIYRFAADLRKIPLEDFRAQVEINFQRLFRPANGA